MEKNKCKPVYEEPNIKKQLYRTLKGIYWTKRVGTIKRRLRKDDTAEEF